MKKEKPVNKEKSDFRNHHTDAGLAEPEQLIMVRK
jgi:hypothetical protein